MAKCTIGLSVSITKRLWWIIFVSSFLSITSSIGVLARKNDEQIQSQTASSEEPTPAKMGFFSRIGLKLGFYLTEKFTDNEKAQLLLTEVKSLVQDLDSNDTEAVKVSRAANTARIAIEAALPALSSSALNATISNCNQITDKEIEQKKFRIKVKNVFSNTFLVLGMIGLVLYSVLQAHYVRKEKVEGIPQLEYLKYVSSACQILGYLLKFSDLILLTCKICMVEWWQLILLFGAYAPHFTIFTYVLKFTQNQVLLSFLGSWESGEKGAINKKQTIKWALYFLTMLIVGVNLYRAWLILQAFSSAFDAGYAEIAMSTIASNFEW